MLLSEVGLLPLQLPLSPPLFSVNLLSQTLHVALLLLHTLPSSGLLAGGDTGTQLALELHFLDTIKQTQKSRENYKVRKCDERNEENQKK